MLTSGLDFIKQNPELIPGDNGLGFVSDDNGITYNRCHCEFPSHPCLLASHLHNLDIMQSGATSRLPTWTSGEERRTANTLTTSTRLVVSTMNVGEMHPYTLSVLLYLHPKTNSTFSPTSVTGTSRSRGVRRATPTPEASAGATRRKTSVRFISTFASYFRPFCARASLTSTSWSLAQTMNGTLACRSSTGCSIDR